AHGAGLVEDAAAEDKADALGGDDPEFDGELVVVAGGGLVTEAAFDHGEDDVLVLPLAEGDAKVAEEFATGAFQDVQVAGVVNMVADGAVGVGDPVLMAEDGRIHGQSLGVVAGRGKTACGAHRVGCSGCEQGCTPGQPGWSRPLPPLRVRTPALRPAGR